MGNSGFMLYQRAPPALKKELDQVQGRVYTKLVTSNYYVHGDFTTTTQAGDTTITTTVGAEAGTNGIRNVSSDQTTDKPSKDDALKGSVKGRATAEVCISSGPPKGKKWKAAVMDHFEAHGDDNTQCVGVFNEGTVAEGEIEK